MHYTIDYRPTNQRKAPTERKRIWGMECGGGVLAFVCGKEEKRPSSREEVIATAAGSTGRVSRRVAATTIPFTRSVDSTSQSAVDQSILSMPVGRARLRSYAVVCGRRSAAQRNCLLMSGLVDDG